MAPIPIAIFVAVPRGATRRRDRTEGGKILVKPRRRSSFPPSCATAWTENSSGGGMGFNVTAVPGSMPGQGAPWGENPNLMRRARLSRRRSPRPCAKRDACSSISTSLPTRTSRFLRASPFCRNYWRPSVTISALRVDLIGHTDSQGSAPYNLDLSQRRAAAVYLWLIQHGLESSRLRSDGRGLMEPIADNATGRRAGTQPARRGKSCELSTRSSRLFLVARKSLKSFEVTRSRSCLLQPLQQLVAHDGIVLRDLDDAACIPPPRGLRP